MSKLKNPDSLKKIFVDYIPAELQNTNSKDWRVVFYCRIPGQNRLKRFRRRVKPLRGKSSRKRLAKRMCDAINEQLKHGWSPFYEGNPKNNFTKLTKVMQIFLDQQERRLQDGNIRRDSLRAYNSYVRNIEEYLKSVGKGDILAVEFTRKFVIGFLDYIYFDLKRSSRTSNNYLSFCSQLANFMIDHDYINENPANHIKKRKNPAKKREIIPESTRKNIFKYLKSNNRHYLALCLLVYFCFIRRTELTRLKVSSVDVGNNTIYIPAEASKNRKNGTVTIPKALKPVIANHIFGAAQNSFLFSSNGFKPGIKKLKPKKISDEWAKMRRDLNFKDTYQFYSLKDTGITNLLEMGVAANKVKNQARHHDISITEMYVERRKDADLTLLNTDFDF